MKIVKPGPDRDVPRGILGGAELSQATTGATNIYMARFRVPAGARSRPHYHANCESALYMLSGRIAIHWGEHLEQTLEVEPGVHSRPPRDARRRQPQTTSPPTTSSPDSPTEDSVGCPGRGGPALGHLRGVLRRQRGTPPAGRPRRSRSQWIEPHSPTTSRQPSRRSRSPPARRRWRRRRGGRPGVPSCCISDLAGLATHAARKRGACQSSPSHHRRGRARGDVAALVAP